MTGRLDKWERSLLGELAESSSGVKLEGKHLRAAARSLVRRGLIRLNKSKSRAFLTPAGEYATRPMTRPGYVIHDC